MTPTYRPGEAYPVTGPCSMASPCPGPDAPRDQHGAGCPLSATATLMQHETAPDALAAETLAELRRAALIEGHDAAHYPTSVVVPTRTLLALLDAAAERDELREDLAALEEVGSRLSALLCDLTGGRLSKATYPVPVMVQEIEQYLSEYHESDLKDERDALAAKVERVRALHYAADNDAARTPICETCHGKAGVHECGCWADRDREPMCGHCREGHWGMSVPWPCPTIRTLDADA